MAARTAEKQRPEKLLEDACIKVSAVISDILGVSGRDMLAALVAGERNPKVLAQLARRSMRAKITVLKEAFTGHHGFLLRTMLGRVDAISADIAALDERIAAEAAPFAAAVSRLDEIPGISLASAYVILAGIGTDMTRFPTAGHLASWARLAPGIKESAGKKKGKGSLTGSGGAGKTRLAPPSAVMHHSTPRGRDFHPPDGMNRGSLIFPAAPSHRLVRPPDCVRRLAASGRATPAAT